MVYGGMSCSIVNGTAPAEDESILAIMDIHRPPTGHVLVIPKSHCQALWDIKPQVAEQTMARRFGWPV